jgi:Icc protein
MNAGVSGPVRLVQLSDCHVPSDPAATYRGLDAGGALERLLVAVRSYSPDLVLLTGDVSEDAGDVSYDRVARSLAGLETPVLALPGNHDDPAVMQRYFPQGPWRGPAFYPLGDWLLVLLDSTVPGRIDGALSRATVSALEQGLADSAAAHVLVALHHQPLPVASPWIDKYALETDQAERLLALLEGDGRARCVTWGHVHQDFRAERGGMLLLGTPSTVANGVPGRAKFTLDENGPACRWLVLGTDGSVETGLVRA